MTMSQLTLYSAETEVTARPLPGPSPANGARGHAYRQAGRSAGKSRLGRSLALPAGGGSDYATLDLLFAGFVASFTTQHIQPQLITSIQFEFLTVRDLKKGKTLCHIKEKSRGCLW